MLKLAKGMTHVGLDALMLLCYLISLSMLSLTLRKIEIGTAYAIWSGIGIVMIVAIGTIFFEEQISVLKIIFIGLILAGVIGLNLIGK